MAARRSPRRSVFRNAPQLQRFVLPNVRPTGRQLGHGSFGAVEELKVNGLRCAGKRIYDALVNEEDEGYENVVQKYVDACQLLSDMRHLNVVQFLGLCFLQDSSLPILVMELLMTSLDELLERTPNIPLAIKKAMLADVARGLIYFHNRPHPVIHRHLSAKNVLLNSALVAKISDLGNSRIVFLQPGQLARTLSKVPGTLVYMPPEALYSPPGVDPSRSRYGVRIDIFSFGHLALFTITQVFPHDLLPPNYPDPQDASRLLGRSEVERRRDYMARLHQQLDQGHPLVRLIGQCLRNDPAHRPSAEEVLQCLEQLEIEDPYQDLTKIEMIGRIEEKEEEVRAKDEVIRNKDDEIGQKEMAVRWKDEQIRNIQSRATVFQPHLLHPRARLEWKRCADLPVGMIKPQCVLVGGRVYVGGGMVEDEDDYQKVFEYFPEGDEWSLLPDHSHAGFALGQFQGQLTTVGGVSEEGERNGRVYRYKKESRQWTEFLKPLTTARAFLSIITTQSAIIACGGITKGEGNEPVMCATVEVYTTETDQWLTTDPLPIACFAMSSITIDDTFYLMGGGDTPDNPTKTVLSASISSLVHKAMSHPQQPAASSQQDGHTSVWKTLPDIPVKCSAAASLGGCLLAVGGADEQDEPISAVHVYFPPTSSWVELTAGELPQPLCSLTTVQLSHNELLTCGGADADAHDAKIVYIGTVTLTDN